MSLSHEQGTSSLASSGLLTIGSVINNNTYKIEKLLGNTSLGEVYVAENISTNEKIQLEIISSREQETIDRLSQEIDLLVALKHPNIVKAFDAGKDGDIFFLASEYEPGNTLLNLIRQGKVTEKMALSYAKDIANALKYTWEYQKVIHRDIKPGNIFITDTGKAKLMGFGIAKSNESQSMGLTGVGFTVGTPEYMSPEQIRAQDDLDFHTDMYSLGCVLYEMLTGRIPFIEPAPILLMQKQMDEDPESPNLVNTLLSQESSDIVLHLMQKEISDRPETWDLLIATLGSIDLSKNSATKETKEKGKGRFGCSALPLLFFVSGAIALTVKLFF